MSSLLLLHCPFFYLSYGYFQQHFSILSNFVVLCHCNMHPLGLLLAFMLNVIFILSYTFKDTDPNTVEFMDWYLIWYLIIFQFVMFFAFSVDFTNRVRAVSSGMLFGSHGDNPLESPVAGRSGRSFCWLVAWGNWLLLMLVYLAKDQSGKHYKDAFALTLPISSTLALSLALIASVLATWKLKPFVADMMMAYVCLAPTVVHFSNSADSVEAYRAEFRQGRYHPALQDQMLQSRDFAWLMIIWQAQILIQAGCHPLVCTCTMIPTIFNAIRSMTCLYRRLTFHDVFTETGTGILIATLLAAYCFDYFAHMAAIRRGMAQSQENALSSLSLSSNLDMHSSGLELAFMQKPKRKAVALVFKDPSADSLEDISVLVADFKREQLLFDIAAWLCF